MKLKHLFLPVIFSCLFISCSKDAEDSVRSGDVDPKLIEGVWRETSTGLIIAITDVGSAAGGKGRIVNVGTAYPASAKDGYPMTVIEYKSGKYWDAYNNTFTPPSSWSPSHIIGLAMNESGSQFLIGTAIYVRQ